MVAVNVVAVHGLTRALLPGMVARAEAQGRRAGLVVVASTAGHLPLPRFATYAATKAFDLAFAEGLAAEMKEAPIDILALCPGTTTTEFQQRSAMPARMFERAESAESVARKALRALGRRRVLVTPPLLRLGLLYNVIARRVGVAGAGAYFRRFGDG